MESFGDDGKVKVNNHGIVSILTAKFSSFTVKYLMQTLHPKNIHT
ncbi:hypothetical protein [Virgibacillus sp. YIM 98842]|nr:hypothetical protein [Virgibacillus sp. YIM 98842]